MQPPNGDHSPSTTLARFGVDEPALGRALDALLGHQVDDADMYFEHIESDSVALDEGLVKRAARAVRQGVGVRAVTGDKTGYAHSDEIDGARLLEAARAARAIADAGGQGTHTVAVAPARAGHDLYPVEEIGRASCRERV